MRIDKFLKVSRILKRRAIGKSACDGGRIKINGRTVKPCHEVKIGDIVEIEFGSGTVVIKVTDIKDTIKKGETLPYEIISE